MMFLQVDLPILSLEACSDLFPLLGVGAGLRFGKHRPTVVLVVCVTLSTT